MGLLEYAAVVGLLDDLCPSSSSSSLVRSMTALADRFAPAVVGGTDEDDCSRDEAGGVLIRLDSLFLSLLIAVRRGGSLISIKSSSSSLLSWLPRGAESPSEIRDHRPSG